MICGVCGREGARGRRVSKVYGKGAELLVIEGVPMVSCRSCGESYLTAETLYEIEQIKLHCASIAVERPVKVALFTKADKTIED